ncbi:MAG TPA: phage minor head protein [Intrasporangium sp.]|uniref:phage minor head protein n=1 Tax=Intrasporangium sp. TaxID=1925024 RepID=UPI002D79B0BF|nr:phage minor head protein [Intrasporangium sp.]HET7398983.1 phage minor head protein [Intrasporangium sp.]
MAIQRETLRLLDGMRVSMLAPVDAAAQALIRSWGTAWNELAAEWDAALVDLVAASKDGRWPSRRQVTRARRAQKAMEATRAALLDLSRDLPVVVTQALPAMTADAADWAQRLAASQYPPQAGTAMQVITTFDRVDPAALEAIARRTTQQVTALSQPLSAQAEQAMRSALVRGVALGDNPRRAAQVMLDRVEGAFNGGRNRALVIARTEMLDAHRAAGMAQDLANADVLAGWDWVATLDRRTCPSCLAKHGTRHRLEEPGPHDHQQGRCARVPATKSWRDLGFDLDEPTDALPDARAWFNGLPDEDQVAIMGQARLDLLRSGNASWEDLTVKRTTPGWRDSWAPRPVSDLAA